MGTGQEPLWTAEFLRESMVCQNVFHDVGIFYLGEQGARATYRGDPKGHFAEAFCTAVFQLARISCRALSRVSLFEQTSRFSFPSTTSFGFGDGEGSGHRFLGSVGLPPSSKGMKWSSS